MPFFNKFSCDADFELAFVSDRPAADTIENKANQQASVSYRPATDTNIDIFKHEASQIPSSSPLTPETVRPHPKS